MSYRFNAKIIQKMQIQKLKMVEQKKTKKKAKKNHIPCAYLMLVFQQKLSKFNEANLKGYATTRKTHSGTRRNSKKLQLKHKNCQNIRKSLSVQKTL